jgi:hypothetical protein
MLVISCRCQFRRLGSVLFRLLFHISCFSASTTPVKVKVQVQVTLRLTISQSVSQSVSKSLCQALSGAHDQIFITVWQLRSCFVGRPLWREDRSVFWICCWLLLFRHHTVYVVTLHVIYWLLNISALVFSDLLILPTLINVHRIGMFILNFYILCNASFA